MKNKQFSEVDQQLLEDIMLHRRDIRGNNFESTEISDIEIEKILQAASLAPSVGFSQPWEFVIIRNTDIKKAVAASFDIENKKAEKLFCNDKQKLYARLKLEGILEAPVNIAVFYKPPLEAVLGQNSMPEMGEYSVVCAIQNMWLMSRSLNIGLGWVSILNPETVKNILHAPKPNKLVAYLCLGYVKEFFDTPELEKRHWKKRNSMNSITHFDRYSKESKQP